MPMPDSGRQSSLDRVRRRGFVTSRSGTHGELNTCNYTVRELMECASDRPTARVHAYATLRISFIYDLALKF